VSCRRGAGSRSGSSYDGGHLRGGARSFTRVAWASVRVGPRLPRGSPNSPRSAATRVGGLRFGRGGPR
jgi:hypothetical protein